VVCTIATRGAQRRRSRRGEFTCRAAWCRNTYDHGHGAIDSVDRGFSTARETSGSLEAPRGVGGLNFKAVFLARRAQFHENVRGILPSGGSAEVEWAVEKLSYVFDPAPEPTRRPLRLGNDGRGPDQVLATRNRTDRVYRRVLAASRRSGPVCHQAYAAFQEARSTATVRLPCSPLHRSTTSAAPTALQLVEIRAILVARPPGHRANGSGRI
jgi:hypothetical protein